MSMRHQQDYFLKKKKPNPKHKTPSMLFSYRKYHRELQDLKKKKRKKRSGLAKGKNKFQRALGYRLASVEGNKAWAFRSLAAPLAAATWGLLCPGLGLPIKHPLSGSECPVFTHMTLLRLCPLIFWSLPCCSDPYFDDPGLHSHSFHPWNWCIFLIFFYLLILTCLHCGLCHLLPPDCQCSLQNRFIALSLSKGREPFSRCSVIRGFCAFPCHSNH